MSPRAKRKLGILGFTVKDLVPYLGMVVIALGGYWTSVIKTQVMDELKQGLDERDAFISKRISEIDKKLDDLIAKRRP